MIEKSVQFMIEMQFMILFFAMTHFLKSMLTSLLLTVTFTTESLVSIIPKTSPFEISNINHQTVILNHKYLSALL